jgi:hypothetical protein
MKSLLLLVMALASAFSAWLLIPTGASADGDLLDPLEPAVAAVTESVPVVAPVAESAPPVVVEAPIVQELPVVHQPSSLAQTAVSSAASLPLRPEIEEATTTVQNVTQPTVQTAVALAGDVVTPVIEVPVVEPLTASVGPALIQPAATVVETLVPGVTNRTLAPAIDGPVDTVEVIDPVLQSTGPADDDGMRQPGEAAGESVVDPTEAVLRSAFPVSPATTPQGSSDALTATSAIAVGASLPIIREPVLAPSGPGLAHGVNGPPAPHRADSLLNSTLGPLQSGGQGGAFGFMAAVLVAGLALLYTPVLVARAIDAAFAPRALAYVPVYPPD